MAEILENSRLFREAELPKKQLSRKFGSGKLTPEPERRTSENGKRVAEFDKRTAEIFKRSSEIGKRASEIDGRSKRPTGIPSKRTSYDNDGAALGSPPGNHSTPQDDSPLSNLLSPSRRISSSQATKPPRAKTPKSPTTSPKPLSSQRTATSQPGKDVTGGSRRASLGDGGSKPGSRRGSATGAAEKRVLAESDRSDIGQQGTESENRVTDNADWSPERDPVGADTREGAKVRPDVSSALEADNTDDESPAPQSSPPRQRPISNHHPPATAYQLAAQEVIFDLDQTDGGLTPRGFDLVQNDGELTPGGNPRGKAELQEALFQALGHQCLNSVLEGYTVTDLTSMTTLELCIDATDACLFDLGQMVPCLRELKLLNSVLPQIRDLGTGLTRLQLLWLPRCGLQEVDGLSSLPQLRELYAAFNDVDDLAPIAGLEHLEVLDLEANKVADLDSVAFLGMCPKLRALTLEGNDVAGESAYRSSVLELIPTLTMLDDEPVALSTAEEDGSGGAPSSSKAPSTSCDSSIFDAQRELVLVRDGIKYARGEAVAVGRRGMAAERATSAPSTSGRPASAAPHFRHSYSAGFPRPWSPSVGNRPMSAIGSRPSSAAGMRPGTARQRPGTALAVQRVLDVLPFADEASDLTFGSDDVFCGNPVQALRRRKAHGRQAAAASASSPPTDLGGETPPDVRIHAGGGAHGGEEHRQLLQELAEMKAQSGKDGDAIELAMEETEGEHSRTDILVVEQPVLHAQPTRGGNRTKLQPRKIEDESRPKQPSSRRSPGVATIAPSSHA